MKVVGVCCILKEKFEEEPLLITLIVSIAVALIIVGCDAIATGAKRRLHSIDEFLVD